MLNTTPQLVSIRDQIFEGIKEMILTNTFEPGDIIPIERMAAEFGVSPTPIREALIRLEGFGIVNLVPNKGARVAQITNQDIRDLWQMRMLLEPFAARVTATLDIEEELDRVESKIRAVLDGSYDFQSYVESDMELHHMLCNNIPNRLLKETIQRVHQLSTRMRYFPENMSQIQESTVTQVSREHLRIISALRSGDRDHVADVVRQHIENGESRALQAIGRQQAAESS